jgi:hypothetical protein
MNREELKESFVKRIKNKEEETGISFKNVGELRRIIEL